MNDGETCRSKFDKIEAFFKNIDVNSISASILLKVMMDKVEEGFVFDSSWRNNCKIFKELKQILMKKRLTGACLVGDGYERLFQGLSNCADFHEKKAFEKMFSLSENELNVIFPKASNMNTDQVVGVGFMTLDSKNELKFIHESFQGFFVAEFFVKKLSCVDKLSEMELKFFKHIWNDSKSK